MLPVKKFFHFMTIQLQFNPTEVITWMRKKKRGRFLVFRGYIASSGTKVSRCPPQPTTTKKYALVKFRIAITTWTPLSCTSRHHAAIICFAFGKMTSESVRKHDDGTFPMKLRVLYCAILSIDIQYTYNI